MGFRGSRFQIPPSRLSEDQALQRLSRWGFFFDCTPCVTTAVILRASHLHRARGWLPVESKRSREVAVGIDLRLEIGDLLLGGGDGIGPGDEAARWLRVARDRDQCLGELRWVAALLAALCLPPLQLLRGAVRVVLDRR